MKISKGLILGLGLAASLSLAGTASAGVVDLGTGGICPTTLGHTPAGGASTGTATACNLVITFNADGSIATTAGPETTYEGIEDALIGVVNNSGHAITSFNLDGGTVNIFGFDGDGINLYTFVGGLEVDIGPVAGNPDTTGYGGFNAFFTNIVGNTGTVNFANGGILDASTDFFSLEQPASLNLTVTNNVPEPGTILLFAFGLLGLGVMMRRRATAI